MIAREQKLLELLGAEDVQFVIPVYQRVYSWTERQCEELWFDLMRCGRSHGDHFMGTILYSEEAPDADRLRRFDLIDGQQRLTTITLLLIAVRDALRADEGHLEGVSAASIDSEYLHAGPGANAPVKLLLSHADRQTLAALVNGSELPEEDELSQYLLDNLAFFAKRMKKEGEAQDAWNGLQGLFTIAAQLEADDQPQLVFESLNSKGMPLRASDLIRNLLFVHFGYDEQVRLYKQYWDPIDALFEDDPEGIRLNAALHGWLVKHAPKLLVRDKSEIYDAFKAYVRNMHGDNLEDLLKSINKYCQDFAANPNSAGAKQSIDWAMGKRTGLVSERKLFGD